MREFIDALEIPDEARARLRELTPGRYVGLAAALTAQLPEA
jgi:adenylosuccinate lyase